jgi:hypothetical protein
VKQRSRKTGTGERTDLTKKGTFTAENAEIAERIQISLCGLGGLRG